VRSESGYNVLIVVPIISKCTDSMKLRIPLTVNPVTDRSRRYLTVSGGAMVGLAWSLGALLGGRAAHGFDIFILLISLILLLVSVWGSQRSLALAPVIDHPEASPIARSTHRVRAASEDTRLIVALAVVALLFRALLTIYFDVNEGLLRGWNTIDQWGYTHISNEIAQRWLMGLPTAFLLKTIAAKDPGYYYYNAVIYYLFGFVTLIPKLINNLLGVATALICYRFCADLFGRPAARITAIYLLLLPSLFWWSCINVRDTQAYFFLIVVVYLFSKLYKKFHIIDCALLLLSTAYLATLRQYIFLELVAASGMAFFMFRSGKLIRNVVTVLCFLGMAYLLFNRFGIGQKFASVENPLSFAEHVRKTNPGATLNYLKDVNISNPTDAGFFLPLGISYFLFSPFPWQLSRSRHALFIPEMLLWWPAMPLLMIGLIHALKHHFRAVIFPISCLLTITIPYALIETNSGTAIRHRSQVIPLIVIFASHGLFVVLNHYRRRTVIRGEQSSSVSHPLTSPQLVQVPESSIINR